MKFIKKNTMLPRYQGKGNQTVTNNTGLNADGKKAVMLADGIYYMTPEQESVLLSLIENLKKDPGADVDHMEGLGKWVQENFDDAGQPTTDEGKGFYNEVYSKTQQPEVTPTLPSGQVPEVLDEQGRVVFPSRKGVEQKINQELIDRGKDPIFNSPYYEIPEGLGQGMSTMGQIEPISINPITGVTIPQQFPQEKVELVDADFTKFTQPVDNTTSEEIIPKRIANKEVLNPTSKSNFNKNNQDVYNDGTNNYIITQDNQGNVVKQQVDETGEVIPGTDYTYADQDEFMADYENMYQLVPEGETNPTANVVQTSNRPRIINEPGIPNLVSKAVNFFKGLGSPGNRIQGPGKERKTKAQRQAERMAKKQERFDKMPIEQQTIVLQKERNRDIQKGIRDANKAGRQQRRGIRLNRKEQGLDETAKITDVRNKQQYETLAKKLEGDVEVGKQKSREKRANIVGRQKGRRNALEGINKAKGEVAKRSADLAAIEATQKIKKGEQTSVDKEFKIKRNAENNKLKVKENRIRKNREKLKKHKNKSYQLHTGDGNVELDPDVIFQEGGMMMDTNANLEEAEKTQYFNKGGRTKGDPKKEVLLNYPAIQLIDVDRNKFAKPNLGISPLVKKVSNKRFSVKVDPQWDARMKNQPIPVGGFTSKMKLNLPATRNVGKSTIKLNTKAHDLYKLGDPKKDFDPKMTISAVRSGVRKPVKPNPYLFEYGGEVEGTYVGRDSSQFREYPQGSFQKGDYPLPKYQGKGNQIITNQWDTPVIEGMENIGGSRSLEDGTSVDKWGNVLASNQDLTFEPKDYAPEAAGFEYDPSTLNVYGNKLQKRGLYTPAAFNIAKWAFDKPYKEKVIMPEFKHKFRPADLDLNPLWKQRNLAAAKIRSNTRGWAGMMGNLQNLNAMTQENLSKTIRQNQLDNVKRRGAFEALQQNWENQHAQEKRRVEQANIGHEGTHEQLLSDAMTQLGKADINAGKLHGAEQRDYIRLTNYVNQLSPDYKVVMDKKGMTHIVHKKTGKTTTLEGLQQNKADQQVKRLNRFAPGLKNTNTTWKWGQGQKQKGGSIRMNRIKNTKRKKLRKIL